MKKIEAVIRPSRLEAVQNALAEFGVCELSVSRIQSDTSGTYLAQKVRLEMTVRDEEVEAVIAGIIEEARTGEEGDGKIFVLPASEARQI